MLAGAWRTGPHAPPWGRGLVRPLWTQLAGPQEVRAEPCGPAAPPPRLCPRRVVEERACSAFTAASFAAAEAR